MKINSLQNILAISVVAAIFFGIMGFRYTHEGKQEKVLRHVVMFKFKEETSETDIKKVEEAFAQLPQKIKEIKDFEWGINNSPEGLSQGFTHCYFLTFASEKDRAVYLPHPEHKKFGAALGPYLDKVLVVDYWAIR